MKRITSIRSCLFVVLLFFCGLTHLCHSKDIRELTQHFNEPDADISPWIFIPKGNIKEISTKEHPGLATIWADDAGKDIKGILKDPIRIDDYRIPWEFQLGLAQNFDVMCGVFSRTQNNSAIGLNVAVTFSDPNTWPKDRTKLPEDTHSLQLFVIHLGHNSGGEGLPQYTLDPHPETYKVWCRGDLDTSVTGDWQIPYVWCGDGSMYAGPASYQLHYRCVILNSTSLQIGIKFDASHGWHMRTVDCSKFGNITGIWEIGPIFSYDRWIPDVLCQYLPKQRFHPIIMDGSYTSGMNVINFPKPQPEAPDPSYENYLDYCVFLNSHQIPFEQYSDDFDIPGYMGQWVIQPQSTYFNTYSNPGYLTMTMVGVGSGTGWGPKNASDIDFSIYPPPFEIETCFIAPDDTIPWNYYLSMFVWGKNGEKHGFWTPGVGNDPVKKKHFYFSQRKAKSVIDVTFEPEVPESILSSKPLYMLIQVIDKSHYRVGFKAKPEDKWYFSKIYDTSADPKKIEIAKLGMGTWSTVNSSRWGAQSGAPMYQKFLINYVHYRYGLSTN